MTEKVTREVSSTGNEQSAAVPVSRSLSGSAQTNAAKPPPAKATAAEATMSSRMSKMLETSMEASAGGEEPASHGRTAAPGGGGKDELLSKMTKLLSDGDELNLAGLLNVLDGVVDTPDRILVRPRPSP